MTTASPTLQDMQAAVSQYAQGQFEGSAAMAKKLAEQFPDHPFGWKLLGCAWLRMGRVGEAVAAMKRAIDITPDDGEALSNLGGALLDNGNIQESLEVCKRAVSVRPDFADAHYNLGNTLRNIGRLEEAAASYRRATELQSNHVSAHLNLGSVLNDLEQFDAALSHFRRALEIDPRFSGAHYNLGNFFKERGQFEAAIASYTSAVESRPDFVEANANLLFSHNYLCDQPASVLSEQARRYGINVARRAVPYADWPGTIDADRRLRVGFVSGDFGEHPVGYFLTEVLDALRARATDRIECIAYPTFVRDDRVAQRIQHACREWHPIAGLSDADAARRIRDDAIDILIDLSGHTAHNRLSMFAWKPAPVQATWLGYFATTGIAEIDYWITDPWVAPENEASHFTEAIWRLPETYLCFSEPDVDVDVKPLPALRNGYLTFACFNSLTKMNDTVVALWSRLLRTVPNSRLFLKTKLLGQEDARRRTVERFAAQGIEQSRLILEGASPRRELLASYGKVDISLDPFPYPGGTTTIESLWSGVPVLSLAGDRFLSHIGESILQNVALPDWIATSADDYVARAVLHSGDLEKLAALRARLRQQVLASPLFDAERFAHHFEHALRGMWMNWIGSRQGVPMRDGSAESDVLREQTDKEIIHPQHVASADTPADKSSAPRDTLLTLKSALESNPEQGRHWLNYIDALIQSGFVGAARNIAGKAREYGLGGVELESLEAQLDRAGALQRKIAEHDSAATPNANVEAAADEQFLRQSSAAAQLFSEGKFAEALQAAQQFSKQFPTHGFGWKLTGAALSQMGRHAEALQALERAVKLSPDDAEVHNGLSVVHCRLGQNKIALVHSKKALELKSDYVDALNNQGVALHGLGRLQEAVESYRLALSLMSDNAEVCNNLGNTLSSLGQFDDAAAYYSRALEIKPEFIAAHSNLLFAHNYRCNQPPMLLFHEACARGQIMSNPARPFSDWSSDRDAGRRLRVGFVSGDFGEHPVGYFLQSMIGAMDSDEIHCIAYPTHLRNDAVMHQLERSFKEWKPAIDLSDETLARRIRNDRIDILIDLSGHTQHNRLPMFAWKPAPVQASWLGYFATTGVEAIDYWIADPWTVPEGEESHFTETVWRLPETYLCFTAPEHGLAVNALPARGNGHVTFGCFNDLAKMNDDVVALWSRVLQAVPGSRLFLKAKQLNESAQLQRTRDRFAAHGIGSERLILEGGSPRRELLASYNRIDIALDPFPYPGGTTSVEALWMGVPVLTLAGDRFLSHIGESIAHNAGLADWIANNSDDYVARAVRHAGNLDALAALRLGLRQQVTASPLFDAKRFARHFEQALRGMWRKWCGQDGNRNVAAKEELSDRQAYDTILAMFHAGCYAEAAAGAEELVSKHTASRLPIWKLLGISYMKMGRIADALEPFRKVLQLEPADAWTHNSMGCALQALGKKSDALRSFLEAIKADPQCTEAHFNAANVWHAQGQHEIALASYRRVLEIDPSHAAACNDMGTVLANLGRLDDAAASYRRAIHEHPEFAEAYNNLGTILNSRGQADEALRCYKQAVEIMPDYAVAHYNMGKTLSDMGRPEDALASYRHAVRIKPDYAHAHNNLGNLLKRTGRFMAAVDSYRAVLAIDPDFSEAHNNLGSTLQDLGELDAALAAYRRALEIRPDYFDARSNLLYACNLINRHPAHSLQEAHHYGTLVARVAQPYSDCQGNSDPDRLLRIGLVSPDLRTHPVGFFIENVLAELAAEHANSVECQAYPARLRDDPVARRIRTHCKGWHAVADLSDEHIAQKIHADGIDILIDLSGHTGHNRLPVFAWKPAPVQASWLGYFATTGVEAIDYWIADPWTVPEGEENQFTETVWRLPETYLCFTAPEHDVAVNALPARGNGHVTFGCFNNLAKMNDDVVALWSRVLQAVPGSRLFLKTKQLNESVPQQRTLERFAVHGIGAERLILEGGSPRRELLASYNRIDIALDPFPYPGGTTSVEALWMGAPVLTLAGDRFLSHIGESIAHNAGLADWIAKDSDDYVARAVRHAGNLDALAALRQGLRQQVTASPLFDAKRFARHFEQALRGMWRKWCER